MTTVRSFERIDYTLRPAKNIERKMIAEVLQRLRPICDPRDARYIGFGSTHFADFRLYHRTLGIQDMVSIEKSLKDKKRMKFNLPFTSVKLKMGTSSQVLPQLTWEKKVICWLDYDEGLTASVVDDVRTVCENAVPGSVLIVTVNVHPPVTNVDPAADDEPPNKKYVSGLGTYGSHLSVGLAEMKGWGTASISQKVVDANVRSSLSNRSRALEDGEQLDYLQLFNFHYEDGARMATFGGVLFDEAQRPQVESLIFSDLTFVSHDATPYSIEIPQLTHRERRLLDQYLPPVGGGLGVKKLSHLPQRDRERYAELYRYFPSFVDADL